MTYAGIESDVRTLIGDAVQTYRFSAAEVYGYINAGIRTLFKLRPTAFFTDGRFPASAASLEPVAVATVVSASGATEVVAPTGDRYQEALVYYAAYRCMERDNPDTQNSALADSYLQKFTEFAKA